MRTWGKRLARLAVAAIVLGLGAGAAWAWAIHWRPSPHAYAFQGVDVSADQGEIDWPSVKAAGADFAYLRATSGRNGRDAAFAANWAETESAGVRRGAIHVWSFCSAAADQANAFNTVVPTADDALPAAVEIDFAPDCAARPDRAVVIGELKTFLTMIETHTGKPALLKVSRPVEAAYRLSDAIPRTLWAVRDFFPPDYTGKAWRMWQASDLRRIDGIDGPVHWDVVAP